METHPAPEIPDHEMIRQIGRGSYGEVWLAQNVMGQFRAVKVVYRDRFESDRPYEREFSGIKKFEPVSRRHESQLDLLHVGRNGDYFYYVMELADDVTNGQEIDSEHYAPRTLKHELQQRGRLPFAECLEIALSLATALKHLHGSGLVHRDVKPSNVIFINGRPKLADIGLVADIDATLSYVGTEGYLPPEGPGQATADIYSLGKVLYEISTGNDRKDFPEIPASLLDSKELARLSELNEVIIKASDSNVQKRYQTAESMIEDLLLLQSQKSVIARRKLERRIRWLARVAVVGGIMLALAGGGYFYQKEQTDIAQKLSKELKNKTEELRQANLSMQLQNSLEAAKDHRFHVAALWANSAKRLTSRGDQSEWKIDMRLNYYLGQLPNVLFLDRSTFYASRTFSGFSQHVEQGEIFFDTLSGNEVGQVNFNPDYLRSDTESFVHLATSERCFWVKEQGNYPLRRIDATSGKLLGQLNVGEGIDRFRVSDAPLKIWATLKNTSIEVEGDRVVSFDTANGKVVWGCTVNGQIQEFELSPDRKHIVVSAIQPRDGNSETIYLIDARNGILLDTRPIAGRATAIRFAGNGRFTIIQKSNDPPDLFAIEIRDEMFGEESKIDRGLPKTNKNLPIGSWTPEWIALVSTAAIVDSRYLEPRVYSLSKRNIVRTLPSLNGYIWSLSISPDERYLSVTTTENQLFIHDLYRGSEWIPIMELSAGESYASFAHPGNRLVVRSGGKSRLIALPAINGNAVRSSRESVSVWDETFRDNAINLPLVETSFDIDTGTVRRRLLKTPYGERALEFDASAEVIDFCKKSGTLITGSTSTGIFLWDEPTGELLDQIDSAQFEVNQLKINKTGRYLACLSQKNAQLLLLQIGSDRRFQSLGLIALNIESKPGPRRRPIRNTLTWDSSGNRLFASLFDRSVVIELNNGQLLAQKFPRAGGGVFSPSGEEILHGINNDDRDLILRSIATPPDDSKTAFGPPIARLIHKSGVFDADWAANGKKILSIPCSTDENPHRSVLLIWDKLKIDERLLNPKAAFSRSVDQENFAVEIVQQSRITCAKFSPDGNLVATGDDVGVVRLFASDTGEFLFALPPMTSHVVGTVFSGQGNRLFAIDSEGNSVSHEFRKLDEPHITAALTVLSDLDSTEATRFVSSKFEDQKSGLEFLKLQPVNSKDYQLKKLVKWHRAELEDGLTNPNTFAPLFHVDELIKHQPEEAQWKTIQEDLIAKRDAQMELAE